jgi:hypothetical protein
MVVLFNITPSLAPTKESLYPLDWRLMWVQEHRLGGGGEENLPTRIRIPVV